MPFELCPLMKVAIPHWQERVSPVFDVACNALLVEVDCGEQRNRRNIALPENEIHTRVKLLADLDTDILICGAISRPLEMALVAAGVDVIAHICGNVECVLQAFIERRLEQDDFLMPGCCGRRRQFRGRRRRTHSGRITPDQGDQSNA